MSVRRSVWVVGVLVLVAVVVMLMVRSCTGEDELTVVDSRHADPDASEWIGTVVEGTLGPGGRPQVEIDFGNRVETIDVARVIAPVCGPSRGAVVEGLLPRLNALLPAGSAVRVVRSTMTDPVGPALSSTSGYLYLETPAAAGGTSTPATVTPTVTTQVPQQPETAASGATTRAEPAALPDGSLPMSVNEVLLSEGLVKMSEPYFNLSVTAEPSLEQQIATARPYLGRDSARVAHLLGVYTEAWNNSIGVQAQCRADDQVRVAEWEHRRAEEARRAEEQRRQREAEAAAAEVLRQQQAQLTALRAGPDGRLYTADDDYTTYGFDADGNLYSVPTPVPAPTYSSGGSGGGGGGGESWFCRRKWWC
ncbi:hypothetical protein ACFWDA_23280 [Rhodococcus zopfii]|uniref:hypothetical protein n=1 Tax=Rhodococcus zopfii TaxID=43772 RepID=UPI003656BAB9